MPNNFPSHQSNSKFLIFYLDFGVAEQCRGLRKDGSALFKHSEFAQPPESANSAVSPKSLPLWRQGATTRPTWFWVLLPKQKDLVSRGKTRGFNIFSSFIFPILPLISTQKKLREVPMQIQNIILTQKAGL